MMTMFFILFMFLMPPVPLSRLAASAQERETSPQQRAQEEAKPARILGQAQTQEEFDAWNTLTQTTALEERIRLGRQFIEQYLESGLTPFVYKELALAYYQLNDIENFIVEGELALKELPNDPAIMPTLARAYAEQGKNDKAIAYARQASESIHSLNRPPATPVIEWHLQINRALSDASYAHGLALLREAFEKEEAGEILEESVSRFERAVDLDPSFEHAYFRLASAYAKINNADGAITNFARVAALEGATAQMARDQLQRIFEILNRESSGIEPEIRKQREFLEQKRRQLREQLEAMRKREEHRRRQEEEILLPPPLVPQRDN